MKRCPSCNRTFDDATLSFCPNDGSGLVQDSPPAAPELQATMLATPSSLGAMNFPPPSNPSGAGSGSSNQPPPGQAWQNPQTPPNPGWAPPPESSPASPAPSSGGMNKKLIFGGIGCVGLLAIVGIVAIVMIFAFSGPTSKMNPYKGDLKDLVPENVGVYKRTDVDVLGDRDKKNFGKVTDAIGVAYKGTSDTEIRMFVGKYDTSKAAEDGLKSFRDDVAGDGFKASEVEKKKVGWRSVGVRYVMTKDASKSRNNKVDLPDGAAIVLVQSSSTTETKQRQFVGWTNGSVVYVIAAEGSAAPDFEKVFDKEVK